MCRLPIVTAYIIISTQEFPWVTADPDDLTNGTVVPLKTVSSSLLQVCIAVCVCVGGGGICGWTICASMCVCIFVLP